MILNDEEYKILKACFMFVESGNVGFEAIEGYHNLEDEEFESGLIDLKGQGF